jgi:hypothetical protein
MSVFTRPRWFADFHTRFLRPPSGGSSRISGGLAAQSQRRYRDGLVWSTDRFEVQLILINVASEITELK